MAERACLSDYEISRKGIQVAVAKAVEFRAIRAALLQGNSPANFRFPTSPPPLVAPSSNQFTAGEYPVFAPSYEGETIPGYGRIQVENQGLSRIFNGAAPEREEDGESDLSDDIKPSLTSRKSLASSGSCPKDQQLCAVDDSKSKKTSSCANQITVLGPHPSNSKASSTCNTCNPAKISKSLGNVNKGSVNFKTVVPLTESHSLLHQSKSDLKSKGPILSRFFPRLRKKPKAEASLTRAQSRSQSDDASQFLEGWGVVSLESIKRELLEANERREAALIETTEMKSSVSELRQKLAHLENYCNDLQAALKKAFQRKAKAAAGTLDGPHLERRSRSIDGGTGRCNASMPFRQELMVEEFLQLVSEARLSVRHFCKTLISQIDETDEDLTKKLNSILHPHNLTLQTKHSKGVLYHVEALINLSLHQDFENCVFRKNGSPNFLDPHRHRREKFSAFVALRSLSWNEVLRKGTKYYSEEFSRFCDEKMSCICSALGWSRQWPERLLQSFFVAAKGIWLLHLLAFSFDPPLRILRVEENRSFDGEYMEDMLSEKQTSQYPARVKTMVMPGFYVEEKVLKCNVLCRYKKVLP